jgi:hypothetical protein
MVDTLLNWIFYNIFAVSGKWQLHLLKVAIWQRWFLIRETQLLHWNNVQLFKFPIDKNYSFYTYFWDPFLFPLSPCLTYIPAFSTVKLQSDSHKKKFVFLIFKRTTMITANICFPNSCYHGNFKMLQKRIFPISYSIEKVFDAKLQTVRDGLIII